MAWGLAERRDRGLREFLGGVYDTYAKEAAIPARIEPDWPEDADTIFPAVCYAARWRGVRRSVWDSHFRCRYTKILSICSDGIRCASHVDSGKGVFAGYPTIIAPRDLLTCELHPGYADHSRDEGHRVWSLFDPNVSAKCPRCKPIGQLTSLGGFISLVSGMPRSKHKPSTMVEMHIRHTQ